MERNEHIEGWKGFAGHVRRALIELALWLLFHGLMRRSSVLLAVYRFLVRVTKLRLEEVCDVVTDEIPDHLQRDLDGGVQRNV